MQTRIRWVALAALLAALWAALAGLLTALMTSWLGAQAAWPSSGLAGTAVSTITLPDGSQHTQHTFLTPAGLHVTLYATGYCAHTLPPTVQLPAHSAPLGLAFSTGHLLPAAYRGGLFVAYHGSTYRTQPTGYKVVYIPVHGTTAGAPQDLVTGWPAWSIAWPPRDDE